MHTRNMYCIGVIVIYSEWIFR